MVTSAPPFMRKESSLVLFEGARRNTAPLGKLQTGGRRTYEFEGSVRADPPSTQRATGLARTGVSRLPIVRWYHGELSGELALSEVLDAVESCVGAEHRERRELVEAVRLYGQAEDVYGGPVGAAVGGVPLSPLMVSENDAPVAAGLWATVFSLPPAEAMRAALVWITGADPEEARAAAEVARGGADSFASLRKALAGLTSEEANLEFKRACLASHPKRPGGRLHEHLAVHVQFELVRHCWETSHPAIFALPRGTSRDTVTSSDGEVEPGASEASYDLLAEVSVRTALDYDLNLKLVTTGGVAGGGGAGGPAPKPLVPPLPEGMDVKEYNARVERYLSHLCSVRDELAEEVERLQHTGAFATLGADPDASTAELIKQYRTQAKKLHPDRNGGDKRAFQELQQAYETIMKERKDQDDESESEDEEDAKPKKTAGASSAEAKAEPPAAADEAEAGTAPGADEGAGGGAGSKEGVENKPPRNGDGGEAPAAAPAGEELDPAVEELLKTLRAGKADAEAAASRASSRAGGPRPKPGEAGPGTGPGGASGERGEADLDADASVEGVQIGGVAAPKPLPTEIASEHAELAAEHASMCTRSSKIAASVAAASKAGGRGGSSVLLSAAGLILDCAEKAATHARRAGTAAASAPSAVMPTLHGLCASDLSPREEKAVRKLMNVVLAAAGAGEASLEAVNELELSTGKNVRESLALMRAHASTPVASVAGPLAAQMLSQVGKAAVRCAEAAMAAAMALADLQHRMDKVFDSRSKEGGAHRKGHKKKSKAGKAGKGADSDEDEDGEAAGADGKAGAKKKAAEGEEEGAGSEGAKKKEGAPGADDPASAPPEAQPKNADEKRLLENRQLLVKLNQQAVQSQTKIKQLIGQSPGLILAVSEAQKDALFNLLAEAIADAESRLARKWYEAGCGARLAVDEWVAAVEEHTAFVTHGAYADKVAVPYALSARLLREAALVDNDLLIGMVRKELFDKVKLLSPDASEPDDQTKLKALVGSFDTTLQRLRKLVPA